MKCKACGSESGKYPFCLACNEKKKQGLVKLCETCHRWHEVGPCPPQAAAPAETFLYEPKAALISQSEAAFLEGIQAGLPEGYRLFPQVNLAAFVKRTDGFRFQNELYRNVDFLITDAQYVPKMAVEINDQTHLNPDRRERDEKVQNILEEAGIPLLKLWTSYGVKPDYIRGRITELLQTPVERKRHAEAKPAAQSQPKKQGCYVATCVYGSYDCPQVWTLRRYRDEYLSAHWYGRWFIKAYYAVSPTVVKHWGRVRWLRAAWRRTLDRKVEKLSESGYANTPYEDPK